MINACFGLERTMILFIWTEKCNLLYCICWSTVKITGDGIASVWFWRQNNLRLCSTSLLCIVILNTWNVQLLVKEYVRFYKHLHILNPTILQYYNVRRRTVYILLRLLWSYSNLHYLLYALKYTLVQHVWLYFISLFSWDSTQHLITTNFEGICKLVKPDRDFFALLSSDEINWKSYFCTGEYTFLKSSLVHMIGTPWGWAKSFCLNTWFFW